MARKWRCDSCKKVFSENDMVQIVDSKKRIWFRCKNCRKKWGDKPRSPGYYAYIQFEGVMGLGFALKFCFVPKFRILTLN